jgi:membrane protease YdiL (CAAX protease family)
MSWDFWLIFLFLIVVLPWRGRQRMRKLMALPSVSGRERIQLYATTILFQWILTALVGWRAFERGISWRELGMANGWTPSVLSLTVIGAALIAVGHWANLRRMTASKHPAIQQLRAMGARLFPRSPAQAFFYILLALTAGCCEEFVFRGFVVAALFRAGFSAWIVVLLSSAMFGIAHLYQGKGGSVGAGILGTLFAMTKIAYHSLLPVVVCHAVLDIVAGLAGAHYFSGRADVAGDMPVINE